MKNQVIFLYSVNYILLILFSGNRDVLKSLEVRNSILRVGFGILYDENVVLRRKLRLAEFENARLYNRMLNFEF